MAQVTETLVRDELKRVEDGYMPMFTLWEFEQLLRGWLDMEALRKDAERLEFLMRAVSGAEFRRIGIVYSGNCTREAIDDYSTPRRGSGAA